MFAAGHLWLLERVDGRRLRFTVDDTGVVRFASGDAHYEPWDEPPVFAHTARHVRSAFHTDAYRLAVDEPGVHVFVGVATVRNGVDYDFDRLPPFVGYEVWDGTAFLPPDRAERAFERLGLAAAPTFEREVDARYFDPGAYEVPGSAVAEGPAYGAVVRNKTGNRAKIVHPDHERDERVVSTAADADAATLADRLVTDDRIASARSAADGDDVGAVRSRVIAAVVREHADLLVHGPAGECPDLDAFRSAVGERVARGLG